MPEKSILQLPKYDVMIGMEATVLGWGAITASDCYDPFHSIEYTNTLKKLTVKIVDNHECENHFMLKLDDSHICAVSTKGNYNFNQVSLFTNTFLNIF